jgi:hypothetical protein
MARRPRSIAITGSAGTRWLWQPSVAVRFVAMSAPPQPVAGAIMAESAGSAP